MLAVKPWCRLRCYYEELTSVCVRARVRHRENSANYFLAIDFIRKLITRTACSPSRHLSVILAERVAALNHEILNYSVEPCVIVKPAPCQCDKILHGLWCFRFK